MSHWLRARPSAGLAWKISGWYRQATATAHVPGFGEVRPGKAAMQEHILLHINRILPWEPGFLLHRTSPGKSLCEAAFTKRNAWRLAPAPWLPFSSLVPPQAWTQGPWFLAAPWSTMVGTLRVGTGTSGLKPEGGWSQCRQWLSKSYIWGKPKWLEILSGQVLTQGQRQVPEKTLDRQRLTRCSRRPRPYLKVFFYEYSSWCKLSKTAISLRNSFLIVLNLQIWNISIILSRENNKLFFYKPVTKNKHILPYLLQMSL